MPLEAWTLCPCPWRHGHCVQVSGQGWGVLPHRAGARPRATWAPVQGPGACARPHAPLAQGTRAPPLGALLDRYTVGNVLDIGRVAPDGPGSPLALPSPYLLYPPYLYGGYGMGIGVAGGTPAHGTGPRVCRLGPKCRVGRVGRASHCPATVCARSTLSALRSKVERSSRPTPCPGRKVQDKVSRTGARRLRPCPGGHGQTSRSPAAPLRCPWTAADGARV